MIAAPPGFFGWTVKVQPSTGIPTWFEVAYLAGRPYARWEIAAACSTFRGAAQTARLVKWAMG